ncbi:MAG: hypothetical protein QXM31_01155 [Candidatus Woesearchaeota archaeon]
MADEESFSPELADKLKEYELLADKRDKERIAKEKADAEKWWQKSAEKMDAYEKAKDKLASLLYATTNGEYTKTLIRILNDQPQKSMHIGEFTRTIQGATTHSYKHEYGIRKCLPDDASPILFYVDDMNKAIVSVPELLNMVTVRGLEGLPELVLTPEQYKKDIVNAVDAALGRLKKDDFVRKYIENK